MTYYYLATGMEGRADQKVEGYVTALSEKEAIDIIIDRNYSHYNDGEKNWIRGCLTARKS